MNRFANRQDILALLGHLKREFPGFAICYKSESRLMKIISKILFFNKYFMTDYITTMFGKIYLPQRGWLDNNNPSHVFAVLRHEAVHLRDAKKFPIFFHLTYLLLLPTVFTLRAFWEYRAYKETIKALHEQNLVSQKLITNIVSQFTTASYLFMFPFKKFLTTRFNNYVKRLDHERQAEQPSPLPDQETIQRRGLDRRGG